jgi:hypothetical protein
VSRITRPGMNISCTRDYLGFYQGTAATPVSRSDNVIPMFNPEYHDQARAGYDGIICGGTLAAESMSQPGHSRGLDRTPVTPAYPSTPAVPRECTCPTRSTCPSRPGPSVSWPSTGWLINAGHQSQRTRGSGRSGSRAPCCSVGAPKDLKAS